MMKYDELLVEVNRRLQVALYNGDPQSIRALRAVVELHKPRDYKVGNWCIGCNADYEYPCPTIQTIQKELA